MNNEQLEQALNEMRDYIDRVVAGGFRSENDIWAERNENGRAASGFRGTIFSSAFAWFA